MTNTRVDDWLDAFVCQPNPHTILSYWDWLPRELKLCVMLYERHRLARRMIYRMGLAFWNVKSCRLQDYDKLDFGEYCSLLSSRLVVSNSAGARTYIHASINEYIVSATLDVPWIVHEKKVHRRKYHDDGCGYYAHLSWLRWNQLPHWVKHEHYAARCINLEIFDERKIRFEGYHLFCSKKALRRANIFLIDHGCL